jgi:hypothetical protein
MQLFIGTLLELEMAAKMFHWLEPCANNGSKLEASLT